jgi:hypothetical protein
MDKKTSWITAELAGGGDFTRPDNDVIVFWAVFN